jgi:hypothetical protein
MRLQKQKFIRISALLVAFFPYLGGNAQSDPELLQQIKSKYPNEKSVELNKDITFEIRMVKGKPEITMRSNEKVIYLKDMSVMGAKQSVYSSEDFKLASYEANVYYLKDGKYKKTSIKDKKEISNYQQYVFYDDMHEYSIDFGNIEEGSIVELNTVHQLKDPRLMRTVFFNEYVPIDELTVKFIVDPDIDISFVPCSLDKINLNYTQINEKSAKLFQWSGKKIPAIEVEENTPNEKYYIAHIIPIIRSYKSGSETVNVLRNVDDLYKWYYGFIEKVTDNVDNTELQKISDSLTVNRDSELEKVKSIYYWVQSNIKYIAFEDGMGGFIPRRPDDILHKRYGDCKDKSCILYTLLKLAGIKSSFTWIGTTDIPYTYSNVPAPSADNHMIVTYKNNGDYYFLDGTSDNLPLGIPSSFIQGKEALIAIDKDNYEIHTVPVISAEKNLVYDSISIQIIDKQLSGSGMATLSGYPFYFFHNRYSDRDNIDQKETVKNYLEKGNNKFMLVDYKVQYLGQFDNSGSLYYDFTVGDYVKTVDNEIYLNLNMDRSITDFRIDDKRKYPLFFDYNSEYKLKTVVTIPDNYQVSYIPKDTKFDSPEYGYTIKYQVEGNQIIYEHTYYRNAMLIGDDNLKNWKTYIKNIENAYKETVLLSKVQD